MEIKRVLRRTGSSIGIVIPKAIIEALGLKPGNEVIVLVPDKLGDSTKDNKT